MPVNVAKYPIRNRGLSYAKCADDALYPTLWNGLIFATSPSATGPFGDRIRDISGFGHHMTFTSMNTAGDWLQKDGGWYVDYDGTNDRTTSTINLPFGEIGSGNFTWSAWFWLNSALDGAICRTTGTFIVSFYARLSASPNNIGAVFNGTTMQSGTSTSAFGVFHHAVMRRIDGNITFFVNGQLTANNFTDTGAFVDAVFEIGRSTNLQGGVDDCLIYKRALSDAECILLYQIGRGGFTIPRRRHQLPRMDYGAPPPSLVWPSMAPSLSVYLTY